MKIEKNILLPKLFKPRGRRDEAWGGQNRKYPFNEMEIGDSIFVPNQSAKGRVGDAAFQYGKRHRVRFTRRTVEGGVRIWRIE